MPRDAAQFAPDPTPPGLVYVNDDDLGLSRENTRAGFSYRDPQGRRVTDQKVLARIEALAIPPAWTEVRICPSAQGHIQATGRDQLGRKQYRYHPDWRGARDGVKYERLIAFGRALPRLRARVAADLRKRGLPREKVLAAVVRVMELTLIRVGNEEYARRNRSFGLTTLRDRHAKITTAGAVFEFRGKSGKIHRTGFRDRRLARVVRACQNLPGQRLFQYVDPDGQRRAIESGDVNGYIREVLGDDFSAKDFRTWAGTIGAARALVHRPKSTSAAEARRNVALCVRAVAALLGNTAAVCRGAYIHPLVLEPYEQAALPLTGRGSPRAFELSVIRFLESARDSTS